MPRLAKKWARPRPAASAPVQGVVAKDGRIKIPASRSAQGLNDRPGIRNWTITSIFAKDGGKSYKTSPQLLTDVRQTASYALSRPHGRGRQSGREAAGAPSAVRMTNRGRKPSTVTRLLPGRARSIYVPSEGPARSQARRAFPPPLEHLLASRCL